MNPTAKQVTEAREFLKRFLRPTRLVRAESLERHSDTKVHLKLESDLPTASFKPRGALYALQKNLEQRQIEGVVASSTGNHGAAVAYAASIARIPATIFLPENPNPVKRARILALGATVVEHGSATEAAAEFARDYDYYFLNDASDPLVPVGTATIAAEILDELPEPDVIFVPMGDTALIRGVAAEARHRLPQVRIIGIQAEEAPAYARSWHERRVITTETCDTIADGLATRIPLAENVRQIRKLVDEVYLVSEREMLEAIGTLLFDEHIVVEPAGAAATAAYLKNADKYAGRNIVLLVTGANITPDVLRRAVNLHENDRGHE
jgi:threonine dehydratase